MARISLNTSETSGDSSILDRFKGALRQEEHWVDSIPPTTNFLNGVEYRINWRAEDVFIMKEVELLHVDSDVAFWIDDEDMIIEYIIENLHNSVLAEYQEKFDNGTRHLTALAVQYYFAAKDFQAHYDNLMRSRYRGGSKSAHFDRIVMELMTYAKIQS